MFTPKQAADELDRALCSDGVRPYREMVADAKELIRDWRSSPGPWIATERETPADRGIDGNVLAWHTIEGCHYTVPARTVADYPSEHPRWMEIPEGGIPEPRPEPKSPGDDEMSQIIELANKLTPKQNREMAEYLSGVADLDEDRAKRPEPTREQSVDHPKHYGGDGDPYEAIKVIEAHNLNFNLGNIVKYVIRASLGKEDSAEDLRKAAWYASREAGQIEAERGRG